MAEAVVAMDITGWAREDGFVPSVAVVCADCIQPDDNGDPMYAEDLESQSDRLRCVRCGRFLDEI